MKFFILSLVFISACANRRDVPVAPKPVHALMDYEKVIENWGPAKDCKEIKNFRYCEIEGKGIVVFRDNKYFTLLEKQKESVKFPVAVLSSGKFTPAKKVFLIPSKQKDWNSHAPLIQSLLIDKGFQLVDSKDKCELLVRTDYGERKSKEALKFLSLEGVSKRQVPEWGIEVESSNSNSLEETFPALVTAATHYSSDANFSRKGEIESNSLSAIALKHFGLVKKE